MTEKRYVDKIRESGGMGEVGTKEDGAIIEMTTIGKKLIIIKEKSIYELVFADSIDPERKNEKLPPTIQKKIIDQGIDSELVSRTFLTAKRFFREGYFNDNIDYLRALTLSVELLSELNVLETEINSLHDREKKEKEKYETQPKQQGSYAIPFINNLETICKTIFQKADHVEQILIDMIGIFYPGEISKNSHFPTVAEYIESKYDNEDGFVKFLSDIKEFMIIVRQIRNGLDHRLTYVTVRNYELQPDSSIISPTIELSHKSAKLARISLSEFLPIVFKNLLFISETSIALLAGKNLKVNGFPYQLREIPESKRQNKFIKYAFWSPFGEGGYYNQ